MNTDPKGSGLIYLQDKAFVIAPEIAEAILEMSAEIDSLQEIVKGYHSAYGKASA